MKRITITIIILLLLGSFAIAELALWPDEDDLRLYPEDWFSAEMADNAEIPDGLSEREAEIYRAGFANGHHVALNPPYVEGMYVLNNNSHKIHRTDCKSTLLIKLDNREHIDFLSLYSRAEGYSECGQCKPLGDTGEE